MVCYIEIRTVDKLLNRSYKKNNIENTPHAMRQMHARTHTHTHQKRRGARVQFSDAHTCEETTVWTQLNCIHPPPRILVDVMLR